jgi:hypothetical protein
MPSVDQAIAAIETTQHVFSWPGRKSRMPKPTRLRDVFNDATRKSVSIARFRITKVQRHQIKRIERQQGHDQALRRLRDSANNEMTGAALEMHFQKQALTAR